MRYCLVQKTTLKKVDRICVEYHDHLSLHYNHRDLMETLLTLGFEVSHSIRKSQIPYTGMIYAWNKGGEML